MNKKQYVVCIICEKPSNKEYCDECAKWVESVDKEIKRRLKIKRGDLK